MTDYLKGFSLRLYGKAFFVVYLTLNFKKRNNFVSVKCNDIFAYVLKTLFLRAEINVDTRQARTWRT